MNSRVDLFWIHIIDYEAVFFSYLKKKLNP